MSNITGTWFWFASLRVFVGCFCNCFIRMARVLGFLNFLGKVIQRSTEYSTNDFQISSKIFLLFEFPSFESKVRVLWRDCP